jgi:uncharacterized protein DUF6502
LLAAYRKLLQPLVRILLRNGVSFGELTEVLKNVFVEVAARDFQIEDRKTSRSRIAIITGLTRKEVAKQEEILKSGNALQVVSNLNRIARVLAGWHSDPKFTGPYGLPLELPFESRGLPSFSDLVKAHSGDMAPRAMLDEMIRVGLVQQTASGAWKVLARAFIPRGFDPNALERLGEVVHDFISTYEFNMYKGTRPGRFERKVYPDDGLREELMPAFDALLRAKGHAFLVEIHNWITAQESTLASKSKGKKRIKTGVGVYHFVSKD